VPTVEGACQLSVRIPANPGDGENQSHEPVKGRSRHGTRRDIATY
jgi:hypothetical protein